MALQSRSASFWRASSLSQFFLQSDNFSNACLKLREATMSPLRKLYTPAQRLLMVIALVTWGGSLVSPVAADDFSFTGSFAADNDVQLFNFVVGAPSNVTLLTYSYAGGTNSAGALIPSGGFDPILALFDSSGLLINQNDDGGSANVPADPVTGAFFDTFLAAALAAGNYTVAVMQYNNFANGPTLADGFVRDGAGNAFFTGPAYGCSNGQFCDVTGANRTNAWAFDILGVESASEVSPVPVPAALPLFAGGLGGLGLMGWWRRRSGKKILVN
jgi:hypothetical protein